MLDRGFVPVTNTRQNGQKEVCRLLVLTTDTYQKWIVHLNSHFSLQLVSIHM